MLLCSNSIGSGGANLGVVPTYQAVENFGLPRRNAGSRTSGGEYTASALGLNSIRTLAECKRRKLKDATVGIECVATTIRFWSHGPTER